MKKYTTWGSLRVNCGRYEKKLSKHKTNFQIQGNKKGRKMNDILYAL